MPEQWDNLGKVYYAFLMLCLIGYRIMVQRKLQEAVVKDSIT